MGGHHPVFSPYGEIDFEPTPNPTYTFTDRHLSPPEEQQALLRTQKPGVQLGLQPSCPPFLSKPMPEASPLMCGVGDAETQTLLHPSAFSLEIQARQAQPRLAGQN